jgi:cell division septum initiation protein DivIVA
MDSLVLIERLDELMAEAKPIPFTREARVDRDEVYKILDRIRTTLPVEFERVRWLGKEAEQEEGLENKLREINEAIAELRRAQHEHDAGGPPLTAAASEQVREIIEAAERAAQSVEREANAEAERMREEAAAHLRRAQEEAERHLRETRERAAAEAADYLRRVEEATKKMLERANSAGTEIDGMLQRLRGSGGSVMEELDAIMSGLTEIEIRRTKPPAPAGQPAGARPARGDASSSGAQATTATPRTGVRVPAGAPRSAAEEPAQQARPAVQHPVPAPARSAPPQRPAPQQRVVTAQRPGPGQRPAPPSQPAAPQQHSAPPQQHAGPQRLQTAMAGSQGEPAVASPPAQPAAGQPPAADRPPQQPASGVRTPQRVRPPAPGEAEVPRHPQQARPSCGSPDLSER